RQDAEANGEADPKGGPQERPVTRMRALFASTPQVRAASPPAPPDREHGRHLEHRNARGPSSGAARHLLPARGEKKRKKNPPLAGRRKEEKFRRLRGKQRGRARAAFRAA